MSFMDTFERGMEKILVPIAIKLNSQIHVSAIRDAFILSFPIVMASSLIILINFAILSPDGFIEYFTSRSDIPKPCRCAASFYSGDERLSQYYGRTDNLPCGPQYCHQLPTG